MALRQQRLIQVEDKEESAVARKSSPVVDSGIRGKPELVCVDHLWNFHGVGRRLQLCGLVHFKQMAQGPGSCDQHHWEGAGLMDLGRCCNAQ